MTEWVIETPTLSRGRATLSTEHELTPQRLASGWPSGKVLAVQGDRVAVRKDDAAAPDWRATTGDVPDGIILLGSLDGIDHYAELVGTIGSAASLRELGVDLGDTDAGLVTTAVALSQWHTRAAFCPVCGRPSAVDPGGWSRRCDLGHQEFPRTDAAVIVLVHDGGDRMVLARQPIWAPGRYSVLAGFVEAGESLENTVRREIAEEIGIAIDGGDDAIRYLGSQPWPFPRSLMIGFAARADPAQPLRPQDGEIEDARWVTRDHVQAMLDAGSWTAAPADPVSTAKHPTISLPSPLSIARKMIEAWVAGG